MPFFGTDMAEMKTFVHKSCIRPLRQEWVRRYAKAFCQARKTRKNRVAKP